MPRISLVEAYNNRDVIAWLVKHQDAIDEMMNILQNVNPDGDLTNIVLKTGDQTIDGVKTFIGKIVANCDIIQNGAAYETHAEQLFTHNDYIVMRDGALGGLQPGEFSGFRVNRYDSVHDGHLVMDSSGVARVGDVGDEQPLATRDEAADMTDGALVVWDSTNVKIKAGSSNIGDDTSPVKIVGGIPVPVTNALQPALSNSTTVISSGVEYVRYGNVIHMEFYGLTVAAGLNYIPSVPKSVKFCSSTIIKGGGGGIVGYSQIDKGTTTITIIANEAATIYGSLTYITE